MLSTPLLAWWKEREPEYHRRKGSDSTDGSISSRVLAEAEKAAADEPTPDTPLDVIEEAIGLDDDSEAKKERRRQRRKSRPHGRAR